MPTPLRSYSLLLAVAPSIVLTQAPLTPKQVYERCRDSVVSIEVETGKETYTGTGFFYENGHTVATALHVIDHAKRITIRARGGNVWLPASVVLDASADTALLNLGADSGRKPIPHAPSDGVGVGDPVVVIGDPLGLTGSLSTGVVGALRTSRGVPLVQITAAVSHGSSGGPVLDAQGRAIGIVSFMLTEGQNVNMAVSTKIAKGLLGSKNALTMADLAALYAEADRLAAKATATKSESAPAKDAGGTNAPPPIEDKRTTRDAARRRFNARLGRAYSDIAAEYVRWLCAWQDKLRQNDDAAVAQLTDEKGRMDDATLTEDEWKDLRGLAEEAEVSQADIRTISESLNALDKISQANLDAQKEVKAAARSNDAARLEDANTAMQTQFRRLNRAVEDFLNLTDGKPWNDFDAFVDGFSSPVTAINLLSRFHCVPDVDLPNSATIRGRGSWHDSELKSGDLVVGVALDGAKPKFVDVSNWRDFWRFCSNHWSDGKAKYVLQIMRGGRSMEIREFGTAG